MSKSGGKKSSSSISKKGNSKSKSSVSKINKNESQKPKPLSLPPEDSNLVHNAPPAPPRPGG